MPILNHIKGNRNKITMLVDQTILFLLVKGTLENFSKFSNMEKSKSTNIVLNNLENSK